MPRFSLHLSVIVGCMHGKWGVHNIAPEPGMVIQQRLVETKKIEWLFALFLQFAERCRVNTYIDRTLRHRSGVSVMTAGLLIGLSLTTQLTPNSDARPRFHLFVALAQIAQIAQIHVFYIRCPWRRLRGPPIAGIRTPLRMISRCCV